MKRIKTCIYTFLLLAFFFAFNHPKCAYAAEQYTITCISLDGTELGTLQINEGGTLGTLPAVDDLYTWIDSMGNTVTATTEPDTSMTITAVRNSDIIEKGTLDSGNLTWFVTDHTLYVTGTGTIGNIPTYNSVNSTKIYGLSLGEVEVVNPITVYKNLTSPAVGDEQNGGYNVVGKDISESYTYPLNISRPVRFTGQTISYPHSTVADYAPWINHAADITEMYFAKTVSFSGNFSLYFNLNSSAISPGKLNQSVYQNLKNIYLFADTSNVTQMSGMFAYLPNLENIFLKSGDSFGTDACVDMSGMFYGDQELTSNTSEYQGVSLDSIINHFSNTSANTDTRYMFFACKSIVHPAISGWNMSSVTDTSYMFTGANSMQLALSGSGDEWDISGWDMSHVYSTTAMFAGSDINMSADDPLSNLWGATTSQVISGEIKLDSWDLSSLQVSVFMFAQNHGITSVTWTSQAPQLCDSSAMFAFNDSLTSVRFENLSTPALLYADVMFFCAAAEEAEMNGSGWDISHLTEARLMYYGTNFAKIILNDTNPSSLQIATGMFANNALLTSLGGDGLSSWALSNLSDASYMFFKNPQLQHLSTSEWGMEKAEHLDYMFAESGSLSNLDFNWNIGTSLISMNCFLFGNGKISMLDLSSWSSTSLETAFAAFAKMSALSTADIRGLKMDNIKIINGLFADDCSLTAIDFTNQPADNLVDAGGVFYNNILLKTISGISSFVGSSTENLSYAFSGCASLTSLDISDWNTTNVKFFQGFLDNAVSLKTLNVGTSFSTTSSVTTAAMFRKNECLTDDSLQAVIAKISTDKLESAYEMFFGTSLLETANLSSKDFSSMKNYTRMFGNDAKLKTIILPDSFLKNATELENVFSSADDIITSLTIVTSANSIPDALANYPWDSDNRIFLKVNGSYINDNPESSYTFTASSGKTATLHFDVVSTLAINDSAAPVTYTWLYGDTTLADDTDTYTATKNSTGTIIVSANISGLTHGKSVSSAFNISDISSITGITATYTGAPVAVGSNYSLDNVVVKVTTANNEEVALSSSDYTVDSELVSHNGANIFTVRYVDDSNNTWSASFSVQGYRLISSVEALYIGPSVAVGSNYSLDYLSLTAYYADDTEKKGGLIVAPTSVDSQTVKSEGVNTFTAYYIDANNSDTLYSATFDVTGYIDKNISSISAEYKGGDIVVGNEYSKDNVIVTLTYDDKTTAITKDFTESSLLVKNAGKNTYTATVVDSKGYTHTDNYTVTGVSSSNGISSVSATYNGAPVKVGENYDKNNVSVLATYSDGTTKTITDFTVNDTTVTAEGENTFTATVADSDGTICTATFTVTGWKLTNISCIDAVYNGPMILVGNNYNKSDVTVTIKFLNNIADEVTTDFTVSSTMVTSVGDNVFTATVIDSSGKQWTDEFIVGGTDDATVISGTYHSNALGVKTGDPNNIVGIIVIIAGLTMLLLILIILRFMPVKTEDSEVNTLEEKNKV